MATKKSFFERLTGTVRMDEDDDASVEDRFETEKTNSAHSQGGKARELKIKGQAGHTDLSDASNGIGDNNWIAQNADEAELTVDVYQTADSIVVKAMIAGVRPEDMDVVITRDEVTIRGHREEERVSNADDYFLRELYWGSFARTVALPEEIDVEEAEAIEKHGLLILKLPKIDKRKQAKLKVKTI